ncbi:MAG: MmcQ/YjbR family DNA-binding protein [bacterium]|nr:MmcQ/YjbR family DNA-binding protein [bacterium]MDN5835269.1 MmcQ/YjbR family DNA-binding protein [bacterium]
MIQAADFEKLLLSYDKVVTDDSLGQGIRAFGFKASDEAEPTLFALVYTDTSPLKISLRCDPQLSLKLREEYITILPGENLDRKIWNTIICSGQLTDDEVFDLARLAYNIASGRA